MKLKWLRWVGVGFFALATVFGILAFLPDASDREPGWLAEIPTHESTLKVYEGMIYPPTSGSRNDVQIIERTRFVEMPFDEFVAKVNKDLRQEEGWRFNRPKDTLTASWNKGNDNGSSTIWIVQEGPRIRVSSSYVHTLGWLEKQKRAFLRFIHR